MMDKAREEIARREYQRMVPTATSAMHWQEKEETRLQLASIMREMNGQLVAIINILFSAAAVFVAVMYYGHYLVDGLEMVSTDRHRLNECHFRRKSCWP
jgi:hypothetical protein